MVNSSFRAPEKAVDWDVFMLTPLKRPPRDEKLEAKRANGLALANWIEHLKKEGIFIAGKK